MKKSNNRKQLDLEILFTLQVFLTLIRLLHYLTAEFKVFRNLDVFKLLRGLGLRV